MRMDIKNVFLGAGRDFKNLWMRIKLRFKLPKNINFSHLHPENNDQCDCEPGIKMALFLGSSMSLCVFNVNSQNQEREPS
jgi:hypothetical protein